jgi:hypothetical protein
VVVGPLTSYSEYSVFESRLLNQMLFVMVFLNLFHVCETEIIWTWVRRSYPTSWRNMKTSSKPTSFVWNRLLCSRLRHAYVAAVHKETEVSLYSFGPCPVYLLNDSNAAPWQKLLPPLHH